MVNFKPRFLGQVRLRLGNPSFRDLIREQQPSTIQPPSPDCIYIGSAAVEMVGSDAENIANQARSEGWTVRTTNDQNGFTYYFWACNPPGAAQPTTPEGKIAQAVTQAASDYLKYKAGPAPIKPVLPLRLPRT